MHNFLSFVVCAFVKYRFRFSERRWAVAGTFVYFGGGKCRAGSDAHFGFLAERIDGR
jgi:hypothetical protein